VSEQEVRYAVLAAERPVMSPTCELAAAVPTTPSNRISRTLFYSAKLLTDR